MFFKTVVLKYFATFTRKYLWWSLYLIQLQDLIKKRFQHKCFPVIIACEIFKSNIFCRATPLVTASVFNSKNIPIASAENKRVLLELKLFVETQRETLVKLFPHLLNNLMLHKDILVVSEMCTFESVDF